MDRLQSCGKGWRKEATTSYARPQVQACRSEGESDCRNHSGDGEACLIGTWDSGHEPGKYLDSTSSFHAFASAPCWPNNTEGKKAHFRCPCRSAIQDGEQVERDPDIRLCLNSFNQPSMEGHLCFCSSAVTNNAVVNLTHLCIQM